MPNATSTHTRASKVMDKIAYQCDCDCDCGRYPHPVSGLNHGVRPILSSVYCEITPECNNRCPDCGNVFVGNGRRYVPHVPPLSVEEWAGVLERVAPPAHNLIITGGEPTLHPRFFEILDLFESAPAEYTIFTNARWEDPSLVARALSGKRGLKGLVVSLHGRDAATHEAFTRVPGSFRQTVRNIRLAVSFQIPVVLSTVITCRNYRQIPDIHRSGMGLGVAGLFFNRCLGGRMAGIGPSGKQLKHALEDIRALCDDGEPVSIGAAIPQCFSPASSGVCGAGASFITIDPWGNIRPCNHSSMTAGNILRDEIGDLMESDTLRRWRAFVPDKCRDCPMLSSCGGGCRAESLSNGNGNDPLISWEPWQSGAKALI